MLKDNIKSTDEKFIDNSIKSDEGDVNNIQNNHSPNKSKKSVDDVKVRKSNNQKSKTLNETTKTKVNSKNSTDEGVNE